jgi:hypothetical protein
VDENDLRVRLRQSNLFEDYDCSKLAFSRYAKYKFSDFDKDCEEVKAEEETDDR